MAGIPDLAMPSLGSLGLDDEQPCALKFLISNNAAGSIIGKGGATISQFQEQSKAKIKVVARPWTDCKPTLASLG